MELRQLNYFLEIARCGTMSEAAKCLHVSQPALSSALKDLERELGFPLFDRQGKHLKINSYGTYYAQRVKNVFATLDDASITIQNSIKDREQTIFCLVNLPIGRVGKIIFRDFYQNHPDIKIRIGFKKTELFNDSSIDMIVFGSTKELPSTKSRISFGSENFVAVLPSNHPLATKDPLYLRDLRNENWIMGEASPMRTCVEEMFSEAGFTPKIAGEMQLYTDILQLVKAGIGCTIGAEYTWFDNEDKELSIRKLADVQRNRTFYAEIPEGILPSQATQQFFTFLKNTRGSLGQNERTSQVSHKNNW